MIARGAMILGLCVLAACSDKSGGAVENDAAAAAFRPPTVTSRADFGGLIERRFHERDANRDDKLQRDELPERAADRILAKWDKDKDGALSATEWGDMMLDRFDVMDLNDDGTVTSDERDLARSKRAGDDTPDVAANAVAEAAH